MDADITSVQKMNTIIGPFLTLTSIIGYMVPYVGYQCNYLLKRSWGHEIKNNAYWESYL